MSRDERPIVAADSGGYRPVPMALFLRSSRRFSLIVASLAVTWGFVLLAAAQQPGYDHLRDSISSLAARGAHLPWIGAMAIAAGGSATVAASLVLRRVSQPAALALGVAGVALLVVALAPIGCPDGAAGCQMYPGGRDWIGKIHLAGVGFYEVGSVTAAASAALALLRSGARRAALAGMLGAGVSLLLFAAAPMDLGLMQRAWLLVHSLLLAGVPYLAVTTAGRGEVTPVGVRGDRPGAERAPAG